MKTYKVTLQYKPVWCWVDANNKEEAIQTALDMNQFTEVDSLREENYTITAVEDK